MIDFLVALLVTVGIVALVLYIRKKNESQSRKKKVIIPEPTQSVALQDIQTLNVTERHQEMSAPGMEHGKDVPRIEYEEDKKTLDHERYLETIEEALEYMRHQADDSKGFELRMTRHVTQDGAVKPQNEIMSILTEAAIKNQWMPNGSKEDDLGRVFSYKRF